MRVRTRYAVAALILSALFAGASPLSIEVAEDPPQLIEYASSELQSYLSQLTEQELVVNGSVGTRIIVGTQGSGPLPGSFRPRPPGDLQPQEILVRSGNADGDDAVVVTGGSDVAVLWAAYALLEQLGVVFDFSGQTLPAQKAKLDLSGLFVCRAPSIAERGPRLHLNFPMDQSSYPLSEFLNWIDRMARLKLNYMILHFYSAHPWFYFKYRGAETRDGHYFVGSRMFGGKYQLPPDMIGRNKIRNDRYYMPPALENMEPGPELIRNTEQRMRKVIHRAHARGIKVCIAFEPLSPPSQVRSHVSDWLKQAESRRALCKDISAERLLAAMKAYPQADEYQLISVEGSSDAPKNMDLKAELHRLCDKYDIPFDPEDEAHFAGGKEAGINLAPYNSARVAKKLEHGLYRPVVSTLRFADIALEALDDKRVAKRLQNNGSQASVAIYLPHARAVSLCVPALTAMMPDGQRLQLMVDYGARGTADQMPTWDAFKNADIDLGVMTWIEFDGLMYLPQAWPQALYDCVRNARQLPLTTLAANHWRVSGLDADAACFSQVPWRQKQSYDEWFDGYLRRVFGNEAAPAARNAYETLQKVTLHSRNRLMNIGFCWEGRYRHRIRYGQQALDTAIRMYGKAGEQFLRVAELADDTAARQRAQYMANRCKCGRIHIRVMQNLIGTQVKSDEAPEKLRAAAKRAEHALQLAKKYMKAYARFVADRGDEGVLVNYQFAVVRRAKELADTAQRTLKMASVDPKKPVMRFTFDEAEGTRISDTTRNGFDAIVEGNPQFVAGKAGKAIELNGETYLKVAGGRAFNPDSFTIALWIKPVDLTARAGLVVKRLRNREAPFVLGLSEDHLRFEGCDETGTFWPFNFSGPKIDAGQWTHVAVTVNGGNEIRMFVNGKIAARKDISASPRSTTAPLIIGREAWGGEAGHSSPAYFEGLLDEIVLFKRALTENEVAALADAG